MVDIFIGSKEPMPMGYHTESVIMQGRQRLIWDLVVEVMQTRVTRGGEVV
jgi:hypothetical protein